MALNNLIETDSRSGVVPRCERWTTVLAVTGMNDVLNSQSYTQAAWLNRIPPAAWALVAIISLAANGMVGALWRRGRPMGLLSGTLPVIVSLSLVLIADIDSPRGGLIPVRPVGLISLAASLRP